MSLLIQTSQRKLQPSTPWVSLTIIVICSLITLFYSRGDSAEQLIWLQRWGMHLQPAAPLWPGLLLSAASTIFLHIQWAHLFGNLAFLLVFGWPVEKRLGHFYYLFLFLFSGMLVNLLLFYQQSSFNLAGFLPVIGASGSISAIIGCYLGLFPGGKIGVYLPLGLFPQFTRLPALLVISAWLVLQVIYTLQSTLSSQMAWKIHLSGFAIGIIIALLIRKINR